MNNLPRTAQEYRRWWAEQRPDIPYGFCWCGCGCKTNLACQNTYKQNYVRGEPRCYLVGHHHRKAHYGDHAIEDRGYSSPCWIWPIIDKRPEKGYGKIKYKDKYYRAHKFYWEMQHGPVPKGLELDHLCRVKACVNPSHLEAVDHTLNMRRRKDLTLTLDKAQRIRHLAATTNLTHKQIGELVECHWDSVWKVVNNKHWKERHTP